MGGVSSWLLAMISVAAQARILRYLGRVSLPMIFLLLAISIINTHNRGCRNTVEGCRPHSARMGSGPKSPKSLLTQEPGLTGKTRRRKTAFPLPAAAVSPAGDSSGLLASWSCITLKLYESALESSLDGCFPAFRQKYWASSVSRLGCTLSSAVFRSEQ
jgi:hypothetical protein